MADSGTSLIKRLRALLGPDAVLEPEAPGGGLLGPPRVAPPSPDAVALLLGTAHEEGWRVRVEGAGTWMPTDSPCDLALTTRRLNRIPAIQPDDLVATVEAGVAADVLRHQLAERTMWMPLDPPGLPGRTIGSIVATATSGPLRTGMGAVRDHLLGVTFVTGDGRMIQSGGRVVKNVAGYDLTRLEVGGFGAFGVIALVHLRLRALPRADLTLALEESRDTLVSLAEDVLATGLTPAALELLSPAVARRDAWLLAIRLAGSAATVSADEATVRASSTHGRRFETLSPEGGRALWQSAAAVFATRPAVLRLGGLPEGLDELVDLLAHQLGDEWISATPAVGAIRWAGETSAERLRKLRSTLATQEVPLTLERAPWDLRAAVGHVGAYREGVASLVGNLRHTFDPGGQFVVALESQ
jgi:glycolate dehydrogenase FAD-binding subunit